MDRTYTGSRKQVICWPLSFFRFTRVLLVGTSSYLGRNLISLFPSQQILFFPQESGIVCIFRWGFPGKHRRIFLRFLMRDIQSIRMK
ncbi:TPA_asm: hypothetical protein HUJ06_031918 [Nelumbo nucifera]|uniref:Photosystem I assembly protein Ycf4 n=1 Tax=Nelumbo nucifera TaxID=4432 RepID=A0A822ZVF7_NELNU|nr:TPA_asm: hypothetical protein HUJ06_031918 [Nelumbo nucifera]